MTKRPVEGATIKITSLYSSNPTLKVGDTMVVGRDVNPPSPIDGFCWVQTTDYPWSGSKFGWVTWEYVIPKPGDSIRITSKDSWPFLEGEEIKVGSVALVRGEPVRRTDNPSQIWITSGPLGERAGWVDWEPIPTTKTYASIKVYFGGVEVPQVAPVSITTASSDSDAELDDEEWDRLKSKCARQRRELRRVNAAHRLAKLECEAAQRALEDVTAGLIMARRALRLQQLEIAALDP